MASYQDILISLMPQFTDALLAGNKTVELRRRLINIEPGGRVWIYTKTPRATIEAIGIVDHVMAARPGRIWATYGSETALSKRDFDVYFSGVTTGCAVVFKSVYNLNESVPLIDLRKRFKNFQPPQFFKSLTPNSPELRFLKSLNDTPKQWAA